MALIIVCGCSQLNETTQSQTIAEAEISRFHNLELKVGMNREEVEQQVSDLLEKPSQYSAYGNNLPGGTVQYRDGNWVLEVKYKSGAPAPRLRNSDGENVGLPPIDETVLEYSIHRSPN